MAIGTPNTSAINAFTTPTGLSYSPFYTLFGRVCFHALRVQEHDLPICVGNRPRRAVAVVHRVRTSMLHPGFLRRAVRESPALFLSFRLVRAARHTLAAISSTMLIARCMFSDSSGVM